MTYQVLNVYRDGTGYDLTKIVTSITWGGDIKQAARRLEIDLAFGDDPSLPKYSVPMGSLLILRNDSKEIIRGVVFESSKDTNGDYKATAYDHLNYLLKSQGSYIFRSLTADSIINKLCGDFGIPIGSIPSTDVTLTKLILRDMSIYDMCITALTETTKRNGKKYMMRMSEGKLNVIEKGRQTVQWTISEGKNLTYGSFSESINDMKNRIVIYGDKDQVLAEVSENSTISQYGILQEIKRESDITVGEAQTIAANMLKDLAKVSQEGNVECLGIDEVEAGTCISVTESMTGLKGTFWVGSDEHNIQDGQHTMKIKLSWTDEVDSKDAPEVEE